MSASLNTARLKGYSIRVSNVSNIAANATVACFNDHSSLTLETIIQEECKKTTRYIWFYQRQKYYSFAPILEICEVKVYGKLVDFCCAENITYFILSSLSCYQLD